MKAMTKQQLAQCAGVNIKTLRNWLLPYRQELQQMGVGKNARLLPPNVVKWIARQFSIDVE